MNGQEFGQRPFVAGSLTGIRAFRVAPDGELTGIYQRQVITPGENHAECLSLERALRKRLDHSLNKAFGLPETPEVEHVLVSVDCSCGFYGYFDGGNDYMLAGGLLGESNCPRVEAIVEAYGACVVGSRGFRAEKLRLVALVHADSRPKRDESRTDQLARWVHAHQKASMRTAGSLTGATVLIVELFGWVAGLAHLALSTAVSVAVVHLRSRGWRAQLMKRLQDLNKLVPLPDADDWDRIKANYPDVPVYTSRKAALAAHPLTVPAEEASA